MKKFPIIKRKKCSFILKSSKGNKGYKFGRFRIGIRAQMTGYLVFKHFESARITLVRLTRAKKVRNKKNLKYIQSALKRFRKRKKLKKKKLKRN